jgi:hypothetical protein
MVRPSGEKPIELGMVSPLRARVAGVARVKL